MIQNLIRRWLSFLAMAVASLALLLYLPAHAIAAPRHYTDLTYPPLPALQVPEPTRLTLDNGLVIYLLEDHELPFVNGSAMVRTGSRFEPADQVGLASLVGSVMRTGGTQKHSGDELNMLLEDRAASIETGIDAVSAGASFNSLTEDADLVLDLFAEVLRQPLFAQDKLDLAKQQYRSSIARRNDDPDDVVRREFQKLLYSPTSPYARTVEYRNLDNIQREDLIRFKQRWFHPNNMLLGVIGDFKTDEMAAKLRQLFADWPAQPGLQVPPLPEVNGKNAKGVFFIEQPQLTQSYVHLGHIGGLRRDPDYFPLTVLNELLNGLSGRMVKNIRTRQGLAYSVYGYWSANFDYPGIFIAGGETRSDATVQMIRSVIEEIERVQREPVTAQELQLAKDSVLSSFVFNFEDRSQTLSRLMRYEYFGYPKDFIFQYQRGVQATTVADIQRVAKAHLKPDQLTILVAGNSKAIRPSLSTLKPTETVQAVDITIPGTAAAQPTAGSRS
ncbi:pitrilysin family protein [Leptolyngbya sp. FACHB-261]|uniref:M16 family metallopeptidase n=1 Tax=Leptolyngbya sp. FACHB-261 TaxID=2692806 RepID=UPI001683CB3C|nr:pitrilysin family protein [Leptolyngbya sp. FACHB-261]MBD2103305.1 insulinase family protein [Leptolyngbya sp. FACHB-261]